MEYKLIINFKTYLESFGEGAKDIEKASKELEETAKAKNVDLILCPSFLDLKELSKTSICFAQHCDAITPGSHTGHILAQNIKESNTKGTLLNHSEHRIDFKTLSKTVELTKEQSLETCICVENEEEISKVKELTPDYIAIEPPELIGGDISISTAQPELITKSVELSKDIPLLVGAGVKNAKDVEIAIKLGAKGILVASGVVKAKDIKAAITDLLNGFPSK